MLGIKSFATAAVVIEGIELPETLKKVQFQTGKRGGHTATMAEIWWSAVAAESEPLEIEQAKWFGVCPTGIT